MRRDESELLGPGQINWLASLVEEGAATPEDARELLRDFVKQVDAGKLSPRMIQHMRDCVSAYLSGKKTLLPSGDRIKPIGVPIGSMEKAFGLTRVSAGQPKIDRDTLCAVAADVLKLLLVGESLEAAAHSISVERKAAKLAVSSDTQVTDAWASNKSDALLWLRISRARGVTEPSGQAWTAQELERLCEIYADVPGVVLPGEKPFEGRHARKAE